MKSKQQIDADDKAIMHAKGLVSIRIRVPVAEEPIYKALAEKSRIAHYKRLEWQ